MKLMITLLVLCGFGSMLDAQATLGAYKNLPIPATPSKTQIIKAIAEFRKLAPGQAYAEWPSAEEPFESGELSPQFMRHGLEALKLFRFIAGLSTDIKINQQWNDFAQHAAVLLYARGYITHTPEFESRWGMENDFFEKGAKGASSSNLGMSEDNLAEFTEACIDDSDITNIARLGHRRWLLFPGLVEVGFGYFERFAATRVFDLDSRPRQSDLAYVAYPPAGFMPLEFYNPELAWHFEIYDLPQFGGLKWDKPLLKVELRRIRDGKTWSISKSKSDGFFSVVSPPIGSGLTLIFRPDDLGTPGNDEQFEVKVFGISDGKGKPIEISYETRFFTAGSSILAK